MGFFIPKTEAKQFEELSWSSKRSNVIITCISECLNKKYGTVNFDMTFHRGGLPQYFSIQGENFYPHFNQEMNGEKGILYCSGRIMFDDKTHRILSTANLVLTSLLSMYVRLDSEKDF